MEINQEKAIDLPGNLLERKYTDDSNIHEDINLSSINEHTEYVNNMDGFQEYVDYLEIKGYGSKITLSGDDTNYFFNLCYN